MLSRRDFLMTTAAATLAAAGSAHAADDPRSLIIDVHQHLWDLTKLNLPWLSSAPEILKKTYHLKEYAEATPGLNIKTIYMEVDVARDQLGDEARHVTDIARDGKSNLIAAVIGGSPDTDKFPGLIEPYLDSPYVKGVRRVLHGDETPKGTCLKKPFIKNIQLLGEHGKSFDLCLRPTDLLDGIKLTEECPNTRFILDHCGNADPRAFNAQLDPSKEPTHKADEWKAGITQFAARPNAICKISGVIAFLPKGADPVEALSPIINHCLDAFGPDRVVFGSDWPVCLLGAPLMTWVETLTKIISTRSKADQTKLWSGNAIKHYGLKIG
jgi:L-fuconolactonase